MAVITGAARLAAEDFSSLRGRSLGVLSNPTGLLPGFGHTVDAMVDAGLDVRAVFGPEHGFRGTAQAGFSEPDAPERDPRTGVRTVDTYLADADRWAELLRELEVDTLVVDLQDIGVRFFTYIWSMHDAMQGACRVPGVRIVVLDRPNPQGRAMRGPMLRDGFTSGIGGDRILLQHGLTIGELARVFATVLLPEAEDGTRLEVEVVECQGWPGGDWSTTGLPWVFPSPGIPSFETALLYPGTGLFEAVNISEGRGTNLPFHLLGAPWVDARWADALRASTDPAVHGVGFRPLAFQPAFNQFEGELCQGVQVHVLDASLLDAPRLGIELMVTARDLYPEFTHRGDDWRWLGLMTGSDATRDRLLAGATTAEITADWPAQAEEWRQTCRAAGLDV